MDRIDFQILNILQENSRTTLSEISKKINLSIPATSERIKKLEDSETIEKFTIKINRSKSGYKLLTIILVNINDTQHINNFRNEIIKYREVIECHHLAGEYDYMLKVLLKDTHELDYFLSHKLDMIKGVTKSNSIIILSTQKETLNREEIINDY
jgi:Lrp/AsnC family leucine-responsive transcriptional regulator